MLKYAASWGIKDVVALFALRLALGLLLGRYLLPGLGLGDPPWAELSDRLLVIVLIWYVVIVLRHGTWHEIGVYAQHPWREVLWGMGGGLTLLVFSSVTERLYSTFLAVSPQIHPLIAMVQSSASWQQFLTPLLLGAVAAPVAEELLYRGATIPALTPRVGIMGAVLISSLFFALLHFNLYWLGEITAVGAGLAVLFILRGSLLAPVVAHALLNGSKLLLFYWGFI